MSIEKYTASAICFLIGIFLVAVLMGMTAVVRRIRKKPVKCDWIISYLIIYSLIAGFHTISPAIYYDDIASPNYAKYAGWKLHNFVLNDMKLLAIFVFGGILLYFVIEKGKYRKAADTVVLICLTALFILITLCLIF